MLTLTLLLFVIHLTVLILFFYYQRKTNQTLFLLQTNLNKLMENTSEYSRCLHLKLAEEKKAHILILAYQLREAIAKQQLDIHSKAIEDLPINLPISDAELAKLFTAKQVLIIKQYWSVVENYVLTHWMTQDRKVKSIFKGRADDLNSELGQLHHSSKILVKQLDIWLTQLNSPS